MSHTALTAIAMTCLVALPGKADAELLGRLFFTPEQRAELERQRMAGHQDPSTLGAVVTLDGIVTPASRAGTAWIGGQPRRVGATASDLRTDVSRHRPGHATLTTPEGGAVVLRVGEAVDRATRHTYDVLPADAIRTNRPSSTR